MLYHTLASLFVLRHDSSLPSNQVAQYIKFEMPVLQSFITKLKEEEDREVQKLRRRYDKFYNLPQSFRFVLALMTTDSVYINPNCYYLT